MSEHLKVLSKKNPYRLEKHRFYELKHFCLQYPLWKQELMEMTYIPGRDVSQSSKGISKPVETIVERSEHLLENVSIVDRASELTDDVIGLYIKRHVTEGYTYETLNAKIRIPCGKDLYYAYYRKFFWILSTLRK